MRSKKVRRKRMNEREIRRDMERATEREREIEIKRERERVRVAKNKDKESRR